MLLRVLRRPQLLLWVSVSRSWSWRLRLAPQTLLLIPSCLSCVLVTPYDAPAGPGQFQDCAGPSGVLADINQSLHCATGVICSSSSLWYMLQAM